MAKIDWQRTKYNRYQPADYSDQNKYDTVVVSERLCKQEQLWPIKGKYHGTHIYKLPLDYLSWVGMNFNIDSTGYKIALLELQRRAIVERKSTHKVSRPDSNTAEKGLVIQHS